MNSEQKTRITVDIYGTQYKLMGNSSVSYMKMVAAHVNDHMNRIAKGHPRLDTPRIAVLAAVNMADEFFKQKAEWEKSLKDNKSDQIMEQYQKLKEEHESLIDAHNISLERLEGHKQKEMNLMEDYSKLQRELENAKKEHEAEKKRIQEENNKAQTIQEAYSKLQEEYAKLQNEFNEWIELAQQDHPGDK